MERTLIIVKPDAVQRGLIGEIVSRFENRGLKIIGLKLMYIDENLAAQHYAEHVGKPFYQGLIDFITSSPVVVGVLEGPDVAAKVRKAVGATNPADAAPGSIRGDFAVDMGRNVVHASDSPASGEREVNLFFKEEELFSGWDRDTEPWIYE